MEWNSHFHRFAESFSGTPLSDQRAGVQRRSSSSFRESLSNCGASSRPPLSIVKRRIENMTKRAKAVARRKKAES